MAHLARTIHGIGPAVVLAHGAGGSIHANYAALIEDLATDHSVIAPNLPSAGKAE
jgi:pimeloyl-ACP methyl ester carboxylesterase